MQQLDWSALRQALHVSAAAASAEVPVWETNPLFLLARAMSRSSPTAVMVYDTSTSRVHYASPEVKAVLGYPPEFYIQHGVQAAISTAPPQHQQALVMLYLNAVALTKRLTPAQRMALRLTTIRPYLRPDGSEIWANLMTLTLDLTPEQDNVRTLISFIAQQPRPAPPVPNGTLTYVRNPEAPADQHEITAVGLQSAETSPIQLSPRELEVLSAAAQGLSSKQIASRLGISIVTVNTHRHRLLLKTGAQNITELVTRALNEGLI